MLNATEAINLVTYFIHRGILISNSLGFRTSTWLLIYFLNSKGRSPKIGDQPVLSSFFFPTKRSLLPGMPKLKHP